MTAFNYTQARENMVEQQVRPWDVLDTRVLDVVVRLPREAFVPEAHRALAYADLELPLGHGQRMFKPVLEGRCLQALALQPGESVLHIGSGSGYLSACMARLARSVLALEILPELARSASAALQQQGIDTVTVEVADVFDWDTEQRFDAICVGAAAVTVPTHFLRWLNPGGRMFVVRGVAPVMEAMLLRHDNPERPESLFETELPYLVGAAPAPTFQL